MGARTLTVIRDAVLLALSLALASGIGGCAMQTVDESDEELVAETEAELHEGEAGDDLDVEIVAVGSDAPGGDEREDPEPEPWTGGSPETESDPPDPGDPYASSETKSSLK